MSAIQTRPQWEEKERAILAPYAQKSADSKGRFFPETSHDFRSEFQRDRDRIVHCSAFRKLEHKTQVVLNGTTSDRFRSRLTHTMEVAAIARTVSRALGLNEDLAEAIALAHDLGHPPFGHPGEHTLNELMRDHGGFEHNRQSLRMVEDLEVKYPEFNGLNLTWETREGLCKHLTADFAEGRYPSLEAQVADAADEIAYCTSDLDDALENTLIGPEELFEIELWDEANSQIDRLYPRLEFDRRCRFCIRLLIDKLVDDLCAESIKNIREAGLVCANDARRQDRKLAGFSLPMRAKLQNLSDFLIERFYFHMAVKETNQRACRVLQALFEFYHKRPHSIGQKAALRIKKDGVFRAICDYVAGMTDGEALKLYARHIGTDDLLNELMPDRG